MNNVSKNEGMREPSYCASDSSLSSESGGGDGGRGSSRSSIGSSLSASPDGSAGSPRGQDPMQYSDDEDEGKEGYKVGGYHAVKVSAYHCGFMLYRSRSLSFLGNGKICGYIRSDLCYKSVSLKYK